MKPPEYVRTVAPGGHLHVTTCAESFDYDDPVRVVARRPALLGMGREEEGSIYQRAGFWQMLFAPCAIVAMVGKGLYHGTCYLVILRALKRLLVSRCWWPPDVRASRRVARWEAME